MNSKYFIAGLIKELENTPIYKPLKNELDLEQKIIAPCIRGYVGNKLNIQDTKLDEAVVSHSNPSRWTKSKKDQNIIVFRCKTTGDIFIKHKEIGTVFIEIKLAKRKGKKTKADSLPEALQRSIGQSIIASMKHNYVICFIAHESNRQELPNDQGKELKEKLWRDYRIALIVRLIK